MEKNRAFAALEKIGWGSFTTMVFLQCGLVCFKQAWVSFQSSLLNVAYVLQGCKQEYSSSIFEIGIISSFYPLGILFGSITFGIIADKHGRILSFKSSIVFATIGCLVLAASIHPFMIAGCFFVIGFGEGGDNSVSGLFLQEFCPPSKRYFITLLALFWGIGGTLAAGIALIIVVSNSTSFYDWRIIVSCDCFIKIFALIIRCFLVETPAFWVTKGDYEKAEHVLNYISIKNTGKGFEFYDMEKTTILTVESDKPLQNPTLKALLCKLFSKKNIKKSVFLGIVRLIQGAFLIAIPFNGSISFMPEFLKELSKPQAYAVILLQQSAAMPGSVLSAKLVAGSLGRKYTSIISLVLGAISTMIFYFSTNLVYVITSQIVTCTSFMFLFMYCGMGAFYTLATENFSTDIRATGMAYTNVCARIGSIVTRITTGILLEYSNGFENTIIIYFIFLLLAGFIVMFLPETRTSKKPMLLSKLRKPTFQ